VTPTARENQKTGKISRADTRHKTKNSARHRKTTDGARFDLPHFGMASMALLQNSA
jgi:hypothetical protein